MRFLIFITFAFALFNCKNTNSSKNTTPITKTEEPQITLTDTVNIKTENLTGVYKQHIVLAPNKNYNLIDSLIIKEGGSLTIPKGSTITAINKKSFIAILRGSKIYINGTATNPVLIKGNNKAGSWGGLILCGNAKTNSKPNVKTALEHVVYGGNNNEDNSGSISYLILKDGGSPITEYINHNGLTLNAIGKNTQLNNIAVLNTANDGLAIVGGNVSLKNIYLKNNTDDALDWDDGWNGSISSTLIEYDKDIHFSSAVEGSYESVPKLNNIAITAPKKAFENLNNELNKRIAFELKNHAQFEATQLSLHNFDIKFKVKNTKYLLNMENINGKPANENATYNESTISKTDFEWVK